jgi:outer membrane protein assembly factor BamB
MNPWSPEESDPFDRDLARMDDASGPSPLFVAQLRTRLRQEARRLASAPPVARDLPARRTVSVPARRPPTLPRVIGRGLNHASAIALIVVVLIVAVTAFGNRNGARVPALIPAGSFATPSAVPSTLADVPTSGGNWARTNTQPGPGLTTLPEIAGRSDSAGLAMALADGVLVVTNPTKATALDAATLRELWTVTLSGATYSPPTIAGGRIYLSVAHNPDSGRGKAADNQLLALSLQDGHELWRVDGAGAYPASPIVDGGTVYALGVANGRYQIGAYQAGDGSVIWQSDVGPYVWCCPRIGIALADGTLAVSDADTVSAFDAATGKGLWGHTPENGDYIGAPMIAGDEVVVNSGNDSAGGRAVTPVAAGAMTAFDLKRGDIRWSNPSVRSEGAWLAAIANGILYAGPWGRGGTGQLALVAAGTGATVWSVTLPHAQGDTRTYDAVETAPVIVGDTAYVVVGTPPDPTGSTAQSSLVAAVDLASGQTRWMAQVDGDLATAPIVSGGRLFALTFDAGLSVLGESGRPVTGTAATVDLRRKVACAETPSQSPMLGSLPATPAIPGVAAWKQPVRFSHIPSGVASNVDPQIAAQLEQRFEEYRACSQSDPYGSVFGFFSTDFYVRLLALDESIYNSKAQPWAIWMAPMQEYLSLDTDSLHLLPDGRIGGLVNSPVMNFYVWWVQEDGVWKIDEYHRVEADPINPNAATPAPSLNPQGTPYG